MKLKKPFQKDGDLITDIQRELEDKDAFRLWWLGQSGFLVQWDGRHVLLDPYLSDSLTSKYAATDKPHVRMTELVIRPDALDFVDVVTSSHNHTDHLDAATLKPLIRANPNLQLVMPEANRAFVADRLGCDTAWPIGLTDGQSATVAGFTFVGIPASHESLETDSAGRHRFLGYVVRFGKWSIYHSGDTMLYDGMVERLRQWEVNVALLPINGRDPARRVSGNLSGTQAARLARAIGASLVIPCHYDMFTFNTAAPETFVAACREIGQPCHVLENGESWTSTSMRKTGA